MFLGFSSDYSKSNIEDDSGFWLDACVKDGCVHGAAIKYAAEIFLQTQRHYARQTVCSFLQESIIGCYYWQSVLLPVFKQISKIAENSTSNIILKKSR